MSNDSNIWGIHGGKTGDADTLFLKKNCIAVGWTKMGDLSPAGAKFRRDCTEITQRTRTKSPLRLVTY